MLHKSLNLSSFILIQGSLDLEQRHMRALLDSDLSTAKGIRECTEASKSLLRCMSAEIHPCKSSVY